MPNSKPDKGWIIACVSDCYPAIGGGIFFEDCHPKHFFDDYDYAVAALFDMQKENPDSDYALFETVAYARQSDVDASVYFLEQVEDEN